MKVLLINNNYIISQLFQIAKKESKHLFVESSSFDKADLYVVNSPDFSDILREQIGQKPCILLVSRQESESFVDEDTNIHLLVKPFLPKQFVEMIESFNQESSVCNVDIQTLQKLPQSNQAPQDNVTYIFNKHEKLGESKMTDSILNLKAKKLKKLLKHSKITLNIEFKD